MDNRFLRSVPCSLVLVACSGEIVSPRSDPWAADVPAAGAGATTSGVPAFGSGQEPSFVTQACASLERDPGPSPLRRLTRFEYDNTVSDLLRLPSEVAKTRFLPEETVDAFDNNAFVLGVSEVQVEAYMTAAQELAAQVDLATLLPCDPALAGCSTELIRQFGRRAYRRPLDEAEVQRLQGVFDAGSADGFESGARLVVQTVLQSPGFLYRPEVSATGVPGEVVALGSHEIASRLSYLVWGSMPDDELLAAADTGTLGDRTQVERQAQRMLQDPKARESLRKFHEQWLQLADISDVQRDPAHYPGFEAIRSLQQEEALAFAEQAYFEEGMTVEGLYRGGFSMRTAELAAFYGEPGPTGSAFSRVSVDPQKRAGLLTLGALMTRGATFDASNPIRRGVWVWRQLMCGELPDPPPDIMVSVPPADPTQTTRERFAAHTSNPACAGCHQLIDGIGFGMENYDAAGRFQALDNGKPIDASGHVMATGDIDGPFEGAIELSQKLAQSQSAKDCLVLQWFRYGQGRSETPLDECSLNQIEQRWREQGYGLAELVVSLTQSDAFLTRRVEEVAP